MGTSYRAAAFTGILALGLTVAGCASDNREPIPMSSPSSAAQPAPAPDATPASPDPSESSDHDGLTSETVEAKCHELLDPQTVYDYNPNVGTDPLYTPTDAASRALDAGGVACGLLHQTSGERYSFAVARFDSDSASRVQDQIAQGSRFVGDLPGEAYFRSDSDRGRIDVFIDRYWVVAESAAFFQASDAAGLIEGIVGALP